MLDTFAGIGGFSYAATAVGALYYARLIIQPDHDSLYTFLSPRVNRIHVEAPPSHYPPEHFRHRSRTLRSANYNALSGHEN